MLHIRQAAWILALVVACQDPQYEQRREIGSSCETDHDCGDTPPYVCLKTTVEGLFSSPLPGGYCSNNYCMTDLDCPAEAACQVVKCVVACFSDAIGFCRKKCDSSSDCRAGYECIQPSGSDGYVSHAICGVSAEAP